MANRRRQADSNGNWQCSKCKEYKPEHEFHKTTANWTGIVSRCRSCIRLNTAWRYGLSEERYLEMVQSQKNRCAVCKEPEVELFDGMLKALSIDHDHSCCPPGKSCGVCVRALLCSGCNTGHKLTESPQLLRAKAEYLEAWQPVLEDRYASATGRKEQRPGTAVSGRQGLSRLTAEQVIEVYQSDHSNAELARLYNVHQSTISAIKTKRSWKTLLNGLEDDDGRRTRATDSG